MSDEKRVSFVLMPADETPVARSPQSYLEDAIRILWRWRMLVILGTILSGLAVFLYLALSPTLYRARATLIIQQPRFSTDLKPESFSLETYRAILLSGHMMSRLSSVLKERQVIPEHWTPERLESTLSVQVYVQAERESPGSRLYVPLLDLVAEYPNAEGAENIVNAWAETFLSESAGLYGQVKESTLAFIEKQYPEIAQELSEREGALKTKQDHYSNSLVDLTDRWTERLLNARFEAQEKELTFERETALLTTEYANETERLIREYEEETDRLHLEFLARSKPELLEKQLSLKEEKLLALQGELVDIQLQVKTSHDQLGHIEQQIQTQPKLLHLSKAITDEALWDQVSKSPSREVAQRLQDLKLSSEILNPAHEKLLEEMIETRITNETLAAKVVHLEKEIGQMEAQVDALRQDLTKLEIELMELASRRRLGLAELTNRRVTGLATLVKVREIGLDQVLEEGKSRVERLTAKRDAALETLERERDYEVGQLKREADSVRKTYGVLAEKHVSAQLAKTEAGLDITLGAPGVAPRSAANTGTAVKTALAVLVGFLIFSLIALAVDYLSRVVRVTRPASEPMPDRRLGYEPPPSSTVSREFANK